MDGVLVNSFVYNGLDGLMVVDGTG